MASAFNNQVREALVFMSQNLSFPGLAAANFFTNDLHWVSDAASF